MGSFSDRALFREVRVSEAGGAAAGVCVESSLKLSLLIASSLDSLEKLCFCAFDQSDSSVMMSCLF